MIDFEEIDQRLKDLGKDRAWLAEESRKKPDTIRGALAPNAPAFKRSESLQRALSDAIERAEAVKSAPATAFESQQLVLRPNDEDYNRWSDAANQRLPEWAANSLNMLAERYQKKATDLQSVETERDRAQKGA